MTPADLLTRGTLAFLGLLAALTLLHALAGRVRWLGLLADPEPAGAAGRRFRPARAVLLALVVLAVLAYPDAASGLPRAGAAWLLAAGNLIYLRDEDRRLRAAVSRRSV